MGIEEAEGAPRHAIPGPSLITSHVDALASRLPGPVVEELAGGLEETYRRHLGLGLTPETAGWTAASGQDDVAPAAAVRPMRSRVLDDAGFDVVTA
jgi:hypothetical protein